MTWWWEHWRFGRTSCSPPTSVCRRRWRKRKRINVSMRSFTLLAWRTARRRRCAYVYHHCKLGLNREFCIVSIFNAIGDVSFLLFNQDLYIGGYWVYPRCVGRRAKANKHRHGADCVAVGFVPGRADDRSRRQHRQRRHRHSPTVSASTAKASARILMQGICTCIRTSVSLYANSRCWFRLAQRGTTIIFSIHQPRYSIYKMFDNLILLSRGRVVYHGPATSALDHFSDLGNVTNDVRPHCAVCGIDERYWCITCYWCMSPGYECEAHNNPPDFFLDVINGESSAVRPTDGESSHSAVSIVLPDSARFSAETAARRLLFLTSRADECDSEIWRHRSARADHKQSGKRWRLRPTGQAKKKQRRWGYFGWRRAVREATRPLQAVSVQQNVCTLINVS